MLTAKKFDAVAIARDDMDKFEIKVQDNKIDWAIEEQEQEFKQALLEGRVLVERRNYSLNSFKFFLWIK